MMKYTPNQKLFYGNYFYLEGESEIKLEEGEVRITSDAQVKFPEEVQEAVSPDLNKLPDTANCYTVFVPEQVKLAINVTISNKIFCGSTIDNHLYNM